LSPQLKRLWETKPNLMRAAQFQATGWLRDHPDDQKQIEDLRGNPEIYSALRGYGLSYMANKWERASQGFIPLVTEEMELRCKIDILFLRPEEPGMIIHGGDLDNRLKTLFDALRLPKDVKEMGGAVPISEPIYCLLEDDRLISEVRVVADNLLLLPSRTEINENDVFLVLDVILESSSSGPWHHAFN
jgi:hypothetical protein